MKGKLSYWLPPNWTWKLEYLYLDLGSIDTTTPFVLFVVIELPRRLGEEYSYQLGNRNDDFTVILWASVNDLHPAAPLTATSLRRARLARASN
jgi:hypothetical protein